MNCTNISHPLIRDGRAQTERDPAALSPTTAELDSRKGADVLDFIARFARQVNHYDSQLNRSDWTAFFQHELPFQIARINRFDLAGWITQYEQLLANVNDQPGFEQVNLLIDFLVESFYQFESWRRDLQGEVSAIATLLNNLINSNLTEALRQLITVINAAQQWSSNGAFAPARNVSEFLQVWPLSPIDLFAVDQQLAQRKSADQYRIERALDLLNTIFDVARKSFKTLIDATPGLLQDSLDTANGNFEPHVGLLYAFIEMLDDAKAELNNLSGDHMEFFYRKVLGIKADQAIPDEAHLVFQLAPNLPASQLEAGTAFKTGLKDVNDNDIFYQLKENVIVDHAQVAALKTLFLDLEVRPQTAAGPKPTNLVKAVHMAPIANSFDGKGEAFQSDNPSWSTMGAVASKMPELDATGEEIGILDYPHPTLGLMVVGDVLLAKEGKRTITLTLSCDRSFLDQEEVAGEKINMANFAQALTTQYALTEATRTAFEEAGLTESIRDAYLDKWYAGLSAFKTNAIENNLTAGSTADQLAKERILLEKYASRRQVWKVAYTSEEGWTYPAEVDIQLLPVVAGSTLIDFQVKIYLDENQLAVQAYDAALHGFTIQQTAPAIQLTYNHDFQALPKTGNSIFQQQFIDTSLYHYFRYIKVEKTALVVDVVGVKNVLIQNDAGPLDPAKPFQLFGPIPKPGSTFYLGSKEIFQKKLKTFTLKMDWEGLPTIAMNEHYKAYTTSPPTDANFKVNTELLQFGEWKNFVTNVACFPAGSRNTLVVTLPANSNKVQAKPIKKELTAFDVNSTEGFIRLVLSPQDFLHNKYAQALSRQMLGQALQALGRNHRTIDGIVYTMVPPNNNIWEDIIPIPNEPYTPTATNLSIDYCATADQSQLAFFHLHPYEGTYLQLEKEGSSLLPAFEAEGQLHIGLENLQPGGGLNLLFQLAESTADPYGEKPCVEWHYLAGNQWKALRPDFELLDDATNGLLADGILQFSLPFDIDQQHTLMPPDYYWIRASVSERAKGVSETIAMHTQAAVVVFDDQEAAIVKTQPNMDGGIISKPVSNIGFVKGIEQPYPSFGGKLLEPTDQFAKRVSERLRHKGRAITLYDWETLVLQDFPEVYKAKCITHTLGKLGKTDRDLHQAPGFVTMAVIPELSHLDQGEQLAPTLSLAILKRIEAFLVERCSPFLRIRALNPRYETVRLVANIRFVKGLNVDFYLKQLQNDVRLFLSPWAAGDQDSLSFGGTVFKSDILTFIEGRSYVDFLTELQMIGEDGLDRTEITGSTARSVLISGTHQFNSITECAGTISRNASMKGIGYQAINSKKKANRFMIE